MKLPPLEPESNASTNSAISARRFFDFYSEETDSEAVRSHIPRPFENVRRGDSAQAAALYGQ